MASGTSVSSCPYCVEDSFTAPSKALLFNHIRLVHSLEPNFNIQCSLEGCSRTFNHLRTYQNHLLAHFSDTSDEEEERSDVIIEDPPINMEQQEAFDVCHSKTLLPYAAKWILKTSETRSLTRAATLGIVEDVSDLITVISQSLQYQTCQILSGVDQETVSKVKEVFHGSTTKPFQDITSFHQQLQYYQEHFNFIVSWILG